MDALLSTVGVAGIMSASPALVMGATGVAVLGFELPQRIAGCQPGSLSVSQYAAGAAQIARRCAPEVVGVSACLALALALRLRGDQEVFIDPDEQEVWDEIKQDWPILMCADTLLSFQAWLRLIVVMFVAARAEATKLPLAGMAAVLFCAGMVARAVLAARTPLYRLEGPLALGGDLPIACEVALLPRLAMLSMDTLRSSPVTASVAVGVTAWFASHHYLNLAADPSVDQLFIMAHMFEIVAAFFYFLNTVMIFKGPKVNDGWRNNISACFMHLVMPAQQALATYYFLTAFEFPRMVASGRPFCVLAWGNLLQLGLYMISMALHFARCFDDSESS